jgi:RNA polymerase sigma-70 factor, ECF subfamily
MREAAVPFRLTSSVQDVTSYSIPPYTQRATIPQFSVTQPVYTPMASSDPLTIRRAINGDESALRALWVAHAPRIDAVVRRLVGDPDQAADIAQEVWIQIFRALPTWRGDSQFSTWAHRIAVNRTLNALRSVRRLAKLETVMEEDTVSVDEDVVDRSFLAQSIDEAVQKLSPGARAVFVLHDVEGYTHEEIAKELGITSGGSKSQLFKARGKLRRLLAHLVDVSSQAQDSDYVTPLD